MLQGSLAPAAAGDAPHLSTQQQPAFPSSTRSARGRGPAGSIPFSHPAPSPGQSLPTAATPVSAGSSPAREHCHRHGAPRGGRSPSPLQNSAGYMHPSLLHSAPTSPGHAAGALCPQLVPSGDSGAALSPAPRPAALADLRDPRTPSAAPLCPAAFPHPSSERLPGRSCLLRTAPGQGPAGPAASCSMGHHDGPLESSWELPGPGCSLRSILQEGETFSNPREHRNRQE